MGPGPAFLPQLPPQHLWRIHLHHDLPLEVPPGIEIQVGVAGSSETVVGNHTVGYKIASSSSDVVQRQIDAKRFDRDDTKGGVILECFSFDLALPRDGRIHRMEEAQALSEPTQ
jgi:hypothetical protein